MRPANSASIIENALCPNAGDGDMLRPEAFTAVSQSLVQSLGECQDPEARELLNQDLNPLLENKALLQAYVGLMIRRIPGARAAINQPKEFP